VRPPTDSLWRAALTPLSECLLAPPHGARLRWLPRSVWSKIRVTVQLVPAQKASCEATAASPSLTTTTSDARSEDRCTR